MFEKDPRFREVSPANLEAYREAKRRAARHERASDAQIERELAELDAAITGMDAARMQELREWAAVEPRRVDHSRVVKRPRRVR
jgi:hypothetical protein